MALSVSGFPEPSRQSTSAHEIFSGDSPQEGHAKNTLMNSPRLRGLFGATSTTTSLGRKQDAKAAHATSSRSDTEGEQLSSTIIGSSSTTPPVTPSLSYSSPSFFEPVSQRDYEMALELPTMGSDRDRDTPKIMPKRAQLPPLPRKVTSSPVRLGPNLARLEIGGAWNRSPPPMHAHSHTKPPPPPPPSVVVQDWPWGAEGAVIQQSSSRPLPSVPANNGDSSKPSQNTVAALTMPIAGPSRHANSLAGPSNHANAVAGPSKHPNALHLASPSSPSSASSVSPSTSPVPSSPPLPAVPAAPASKVIILQPTPQRANAHAHKPSASSLSMRYQPLVGEPSGSVQEAIVNDLNANANANYNTNGHTSSSIRPLPRIPPTTTSSSLSLSSSSFPSSSPSSSNPNSGSTAKLPLPARYYPPPARVPRPKTSPNPITGFATAAASLSGGRPNINANANSNTTSSSSRLSRSPFADSVTGTSPGWAPRQRANSPPLPISNMSIGINGKQHPRARSVSRTRSTRDWSADAPRTRVPASPTIGGARPKKTPFGDRGELGMGGSGSVNALKAGSAGLHIQTALAMHVSSASVSSNAAASKGRAFSGVSTTLKPAGPMKPSPRVVTAGTARGPSLSRDQALAQMQTQVVLVQPSTPSPTSAGVKAAVASATTNVVPTTITTTANNNTDDDSAPSPPSAISTLPDTHSILESPLHLHPIDAQHVLTDTESLLHYPHAAVSPIAATAETGEAESPVEVFMDDTNLSTLPPSLSRDPSPIWYARPDSRGHVGSDTERNRGRYVDVEDDGGGYVGAGSGRGRTRARNSRESSSSNGARASRSRSSDSLLSLSDGGGGGVGRAGGGRRRRRRRTEQLRTYRNSYRPRERMSSPPHIPYQSESLEGRGAAVQQQHQEWENQLDAWGDGSTPGIGAGNIVKDKKAKKNKKQKEKEKEKDASRKTRSYFSGGLSAPATRASSPERKSRSRQPRRLAEAVSSALEEVRGGSPIRRAAGSSKSVGGVGGVRAGHAGTVYGNDSEVLLDITPASLSRRETSNTLETTTSSSASDNIGGEGGSGVAGAGAGGSVGGSGSSARWSKAAGWARVMSKKQLEGGEKEQFAHNNSSGSLSLSVPYVVSSVVTTTTTVATTMGVDANGGDGWAAGSKPPTTFVPPPPSAHRRYRRRDSLNFDESEYDYGDEPPTSLDGTSCGMGSGPAGRGGGKPRVIETTITTTITAERPPSSTPFSGFSLTGRGSSKKLSGLTAASSKKRTASVAGVLPSSAPAASDEMTFAAAMDREPLLRPAQGAGLGLGLGLGPQVGLALGQGDEEEGASGEASVVVARRVMRGVDQAGDGWEHEQVTDVADVIPHLRSLKASKS